MSVDVGKRAINSTTRLDRKLVADEPVRASRTVVEAAVTARMCQLRIEADYVSSSHQFYFDNEVQLKRESTMAKAYWVATYRSISNPDAFAAYAKVSGSAITAAGGRIVVRGNPVKVYESGLMQRVVIIEFDNLETALAAHDTAAYQAALKLLDKGAERDIRIVEGLV
jgi:uncharacterized protein (DUF1330 family)